MKKKTVLCVVLTVITMILAQFMCLTACDKKTGENSGTETKGEIEESSTETNAEKIIISFDSDGGTKVDDVYIVKGKKIVEPKTPYKQKTEGGYSWVYEFLGWYDGETKWDFSKAVEKEVILKAKWGKGVKYATSEKIYPD